MPHPSPEVDAYLDSLDHPLAAEVRALRNDILALDERLTEHIKWKAPSFVVAGDDRVTFALRPGKGLEVILHRGVAVRDDTAASSPTTRASSAGRPRTGASCRCPTRPP